MKYNSSSSTFIVVTTRMSPLCWQQVVSDVIHLWLALTVSMWLLVEHITLSVERLIAGVNGWSQWSWLIQKPRVKICTETSLQSALHTPVVDLQSVTDFNWRFNKIRNGMLFSAVVNMLRMCCRYWPTGRYSCLLTFFVQYLFYEALLLLLHFLVHWTHTHMLLPPLTALTVETPQWVKAPPTALSRLRWCVFCVYVWGML